MRDKIENKTETKSLHLPKHSLYGVFYLHLLTPINYPNLDQHIMNWLGGGFKRGDDPILDYLGWWFFGWIPNSDIFVKAEF